MRRHILQLCRFLLTTNAILNCRQALLCQNPSGTRGHSNNT